MDEPKENTLLHILRNEISDSDKNIIDKKFLHLDLFHFGTKWLENNSHENCSVVIKEPKCSGNKEIPDIIGFNHIHSVMIEVKVSRSDFLRDKLKPHRNGKGIGNFRFYLCPPDVIHISDLPDKWGLLYYINGKIQIIVNPFHGNINSKSPNKFETDYKSERSILFSRLRKLKL